MTYFSDDAIARISDAVKFREGFVSNQTHTHAIYDEGLPTRGLFLYTNLTDDPIPRYSLVVPENSRDIEDDAEEPHYDIRGTSEEIEDRNIPGTMIAQEYIGAGRSGILRFRGLSWVRCIQAGGVSKGSTGLLGDEEGNPHLADVSEGSGIFNDVLWAQEGDELTDETIALVYLGGWPPGQYRSFNYSFEIID